MATLMPEAMALFLYTHNEDRFSVTSQSDQTLKPAAFAKLCNSKIGPKKPLLKLFIWEYIGKYIFSNTKSKSLLFVLGSICA